MIQVNDFVPDDASRVFVDSADRLWLQLSDGSIIMKDCDGKMYDVAVAGEGVVLCGVVNDRSICHIFTSDGKRLQWDNEGQRVALTDHYASSDNNVWTHVISCRYGDGNIVAIDRYLEGGLFFLRDGAFRPLPLDERGFLKLMPDGEGGFFLVCWMNIWHYNSDFQLIEQINHFDTPRGVINNQFIHDATVDWQGGLWVAHTVNGLLHTNNAANMVRHINLPELNDYDIVSMFPWKDDTLIIITIMGVYKFNTRTFDIEPMQGLTTDEFYTGAPLPASDALLLATRDGLYVVGDDGAMFHNTSDIKNLPYDKFRFVIPVNDNNLLCCSGPVEIGYLNLDSLVFTPVGKNALMSTLHREFDRYCYDKLRNCIYLASAQGFFRLDLSTGVTAHVVDKSSKYYSYGNNIHDLYLNPSGDLTVATSKGLLVINASGDTLVIDSGAGLPEDGTQSICTDGNRSLWVGTVHGLSRIVTSRSDMHLQPHLPLSIRNISMNGILSGNELISGGVVATGDTLWCATTDGLYLVLPSGYDVMAERPELILSSVQLEGGKELYPQASGASIDLRHDENFFTLHLSTCNYLWPEYSRFRYMLKGYDRDWKEVNDGKCGIDLSYTKVPPGKYELLVAYSLDNGQWSDTYKWNIRVLPPAHRTWWAYCLYILGFILLVILGLFIYRKYLSLIRRLKEKRNKYIIQATEVKQEAVEIKDRDKAILDKAVAFVNNNIGNAGYSVEELSNDMGMSRSTLYRNLQNIVGQTPTEFINTIRCRSAARMIKESKQSIKEIAFSVGFNDARYFRKAFKGIYGVTPQEYRDN